MAFKDRYPTEIDFEIDRKQLLRYWRMQAVLGCSGATLPFAVLIAMAFFKSHLESHRDLSVGSLTVWFILYVVVGTAAGLLVACLIYLLMCHLPAQRASQNLRLMVEGPYLRFVSGGYFVTDRRIHFRSVSDYSTHEGPLLRKLGMKSLSFRIAGSGQMPLLHHVVGLVNPDDVRDQLCEIDAARENSEDHT